MGVVGLCGEGGPQARGEIMAKIVKEESEWRTLLTEPEYEVIREKGTELPDPLSGFLLGMDGTAVWLTTKTEELTPPAKEQHDD